MFLGKELQGKDMMTTATAKPPWGPGFTPTQVSKADRLKVLFSSFKDEGEDFTIFQLVDINGHVLNQEQIGGY